MDCNGSTNVVTSPNTTIVSQNYPNNYDDNKDCRITIRFSTGQRVYIEFLDFELEADSDCDYDWLEIRDGDSANSNIIGSKLCGSGTPSPVESTGNSLTLVFHSDFSVNRKGFQIRVGIGKSYY